MAIRRINGWHIFDGVTPLSVLATLESELFAWKLHRGECLLFSGHLLAVHEIS